jgi:hypothetical protein
MESNNGERNEPPRRQEQKEQKEPNEWPARSASKEPLAGAAGWQKFFSFCSLRSSGLGGSR